MITVTVGSVVKGYSFHRLIKRMDGLCLNINTPVWMQIGSSIYEPRNCSFERFKPFHELNDKFRQSELIISHCAVGTLLCARKLQKKIVLLPRDPKLGEHLDSHQLEIAEKFKQLPWVFIANEENLFEVISEARAHSITPESFIPGESDMLTTNLTKALRNL